MPAAAPTVVSLFAGAGGLDLGFRDAGFALLWANELDADAAATYRRHLGPHLHPGDLHAVAAADIPDCDVVIGGPPCQGFSVAGKMDPDDPRSGLVWQFVRVVAEKRPAAFVMENVKALATLRKWAAVRGALRARFAALGYHVACRVLDASRFGVPQLRQRIFFVGLRTGDAESAFPEPLDDLVSVRGALAALPPYGRPGNDSLCRAAVVPAKRPVLRRSPYAGMLFNGLGRPVRLDRPAPTLPASMGGNKTPIIDQHALETGEANWAEAYHARLLAGGQPLASAPPRLRRLTVEECAALQSFPTGYHFAGEQSSRFRQIGNAVPPRLAFHLAARLRAVLASPPPLMRRLHPTAAAIASG